MRRRRGRPGAIALVTVLWGALLLGWLQLTPLYRAADEPTHVDLVLRLRDGGSYAAPGTLDVDPRVRASFPLANLSTAERPELADHVPLPFTSTDVPPRDLSYDELPAPQGLAPYRNQMTQHPPLYYALQAGVLAVPVFAAMNGSAVCASSPGYQRQVTPERSIGLPSAQMRPMPVPSKGAPSACSP